MDFLSHALWTNLIYQNADPTTRYLAIGLGTAPDLISFAPEVIKTTIRRQLRRWRNAPDITDGNMPQSIPSWVYRLYDFTHSLPLWLLGFGVWWSIAGHVPWAAFAWLLHILVDIPTHTKRFFPTPFLWPLSNFRIDGISWASPWFMRLNYGAIVILYVYCYLLR